jgi:NADPH-dependent curcumin reductase CurA
VIPTTTRLVVLRRRPAPGGRPHPDDFAIEERPVPSLGPDQLLVRNIAMSVDPSMRGRLDVGEKHYTTNFEIDAPLDGSAVGEVIDSSTGDVPVGAVVRHRLGWRDHAVVDAGAATVIDTDVAPVGAWLGILGQTGFTAWVGLTRIAELREGDTVFVSAAGGAVGSAAGSFARLLGA